MGANRPNALVTAAGFPLYSNMISEQTLGNGHGSYFADSITVRFIPERAKFFNCLILLEVFLNEDASHVDMQCTQLFRCCEKLSIGDVCSGQGVDQYIHIIGRTL